MTFKSLFKKLHSVAEKIAVRIIFEVNGYVFTCRAGLSLLSLQLCNIHVHNFTWHKQLKTAFTTTSSYSDFCLYSGS